MGFWGDLGGRIVGAPSILAADFANLAEEVRRAQAGGAELVHFDAMDNQFVPNLTVGPVVAASLVEAIELPVDAHLMVDSPDNLIPPFIEAGVASISVQPEAVTHLHRTLTMIRDGGCEAGVALNPTTPPESIEWALPYLDYVLVMTVNPGFGGQAYISTMEPKIREAAKMIEASGLTIDLEVDGGISPDTIAGAAAAGARVLVAGSALYKHAGGLADAVSTLRRLAEEALAA